MAEQQPKPLDALADIAAGIHAEQQLARDTRQAIDATLRIYAQWRSHLQELSMLCARSGLNNMLTAAATIDQDAATLLTDILTTAQTFHASLTDEPFPTMHAEPVPPEEPEP